MITNAVIDHIFLNHGHRISQWNFDILSPPMLQDYPDVIHAKDAPLNKFFGVIDGTVRPISCPGQHQRIALNSYIHCDFKFCHKASVIKSLNWSLVDNQLWLTIFTVSPAVLNEEYPLFSNGPQCSVSRKGGNNRGTRNTYNRHGIRGITYEWFTSYLDNRNQQCFVNGSISNSQILTCGIPQGTILGPLLLILYINDLPNCLSNSVARMYADDTDLTFASNKIEMINDVMNLDLSNVNTWLTANKLTLSSSKTEFRLIGSRQRLVTYDTSPKLIIGGNIIKQVSSVKSLGVHMDENLSWNMHIEKIAKKIASGIGAIKCCRPFVNQITLESVFNALVQAYFNYCSEVWGRCNKSL